MPRLTSEQGQVRGGRINRSPKGLRALFGLAILAGCSAAVSAADVEADASFGLGYRDAELMWNIAGTLAGTQPNILSELRWKDLQIAEVHAAGEVDVDKRLLLRGRAAYGEVVEGDNQDSDYAGDNRTFEFSRSNNKGGGQVGEATLGVGYQFWWYDGTVGRYARFTPMFGYAWRGHYLTISDGRQTIPAGAAGPIAGLDSRYDAEWQGPWLGFTMLMDATDRTRVTLDVEYHYADYRAEADWNLRTDLAHPVSFLHETRATGVVVGLEVRHDLTPAWAITTRFESQNFEGEAGLDTVNLIDEDTGAVDPTVTRFNTAKWESLTATLMATWRF